ncbi:hypothetical protein M9458_052068 [Cirrhinus mrigala]|uniref:Alkylated DNA repair protein AlkB homologue 8 N-terminal domain-containing protein n=1 Tax=Cirrhinus mrigala TaxID=683832 RepID=A0ABD0MQL3_CIRMR
MLIPAYRPLLKLAKPVQKQITVWPDDATSTLQDCFQYTDWNMFREAATYNNHTDLHEYTKTVTVYIKKCIDDVTVTKTITTRANQKPWMTAEDRGLLKTRDDAFRSGDKAALKTARANLYHGIKQAKRLYAQKNNHFTDSKDTRSLWQAIQTITDYKPLPQTCDDDTTLPDALNEFYTRFEMQNDTPAQKLPTTPNNQALCLLHPTERKWHNWLNGVVQTTCPSISAVERVSSTKFLGVHITEDLTWTTNIMSLSKKAQQRLHFLRRLKRASLPPPILTTFYRGTIESVLTSCITVWYGNCSAADRKTLQRTVNTDAKIIGAPLPSLLDIFLARCSGKATSIVKDPTHPPIISFSSCHQEDATGASEPALQDCSTAFSPRL